MFSYHAEFPIPLTKTLEKGDDVVSLAELLENGYLVCNVM